MRRSVCICALFIAGLAMISSEAIARGPSVNVGMKQVKVRMSGRHNLMNVKTADRIYLTVSRRHKNGATARRSARRAIGKLQRELRADLISKYGVKKGGAIAKTMKIQKFADMSEQGWRSQGVDRAAYTMEVVVPKKGHMRVRDSLIEKLQNTMQPEYDRYGYRSQRNYRTESVLDQKKIDTQVAKLVKSQIKSARAIATQGLKAQGRTGKLQGADISSYNWTWRGPTQIDVTVNAAFGFEAAKTRTRK